MNKPIIQPMKQKLARLLVAGTVALTTAANVFAASQTWTNAPADNTWTNILNWNSRAVPGALNSSTIADIATFTNALPISGFGGISRPITNDATRGVRGFVFDTANCGAYVFGGSLGDNYIDVNSPLFSTGYDQGGSIVMNAPVLNPISFNQGVRVRFPSSTNVRYDITNNATSANATLFFAAITNTSASTRPLFLYLNGSNTGTNTIARIDDQVGGSGAIQLWKEGTGRWILSGPNDLPQKTSAGSIASISIEGGTLEVQDAGSLGAITVGNLYVTNATLQIDGVTLNNAGITLRKNSTIQMKGSGTVNGVTVGNQAANSATLATTSSSDVMTVGIAANRLTGGAADTVMHVSGSGTVSLGFDANYVGRWTVDAGSLSLSTAASLGTGANLNIAAGGTFDVSVLGASTYTLGTAAFSASGTGITVGTTAATIKADAAGTVDLATGSKAISLTFTPTTFSGDTTHPSVYVSQGTLALGGNSFTVNNAGGTPLGVGTYRVIAQASGIVTDGGGYAVAVTGSGKAAGTVAAIQVSGGNVNLVISAYIPKNLVWTGNAANANWNVATDASWLNGAAVSTFNNSDLVTFNSVGLTNPTVTLVSTLAPGSVTVDTSANDYTFTGSGVIAGTASLLKKSPGTLNLNTVNTYSGGTVVSNGVLVLGADNAVPSTGAGDVQVTSPGKLDVNGHQDTINALTGNGTIDNVTSGGTSVLTVGNNDNSGTFSGLIQNTTGTVGLTKAGNGVETLSSANSYTGPTTVNTGTLRVSNLNALGAGGSTVNLNGGILDMATDVVVGIFGGSGGTIANNTTSTTNTLVVTNTGTLNAVITDGSGGGGVKVLVTSGTLRENGNSSYSGGTIISVGAGFEFGSGAANAGAGGIIASNNTTIRQANTGSGSSGPGNTITTVDGATVTFSSGVTANNWGGQFVGSTTATNVFANGIMSIGGANSFAGFLGTVIITNGTVRMNNASGGGDSSTFIFTNSGGMFTRDANTIHLGALFGNGRIDNPSVSYPGNYWIGAKGIDSEYSGNISGSNNIVKTGAGRLTLDGAPYTLDTDGSTYTNILYSGPVINYLNNTTISNGVLALSVPNNLNNSPFITLAGTGATLDASNMGYITNFTTVFGGGNSSALITNGILEILATTPNGTPQTLNGFGSITGKLLADAGSTLNPGNPTGNVTTGTGTGVLNVSGSASIAGTVNMRLNNTNTFFADEITANSFTIDPAATLNVTNIGSALAAGNVFQLFNHPVTFTPANITLPVVSSPLILSNKLSINGSIVILSTVNTTPTNLTSSVSGNVLTLSWPADHTGWRLQSQTNTLGVGLNPATWTAVPGSASVNTMNFTIDPTSPTVFYRMVYP